MKYSKHAKQRITERGITEKNDSGSHIQTSPNILRLNHGNNRHLQKTQQKTSFSGVLQRKQRNQNCNNVYNIKPPRNNQQKTQNKNMGENQMKVQYDRESDILYLKFKDSKITQTQMLSEDAYIDLDEKGNLIGIEIWKASQNAILPISKDIAEKLKIILKNPA